MKKIYLIVFVLLTYINAYAEWITINKVDDFTDEKIKILSFETKETIIQIDRKDNSFWMNIKHKNSGIISPETDVEIKIDKNKTYVENLGFWNKIYQENGTDMDKRDALLSDKIMMFNLFQSLYSKQDFVCDISKGKFLKLRYSLDNGHKEILNISLKGITEKMKIVFGDEIFSKCK